MAEPVGKTCGQCRFLYQDCTDEEPGNKACPEFQPLEEEGE
jgi:hypothetical protein